jgi:hypothetical protein
MRFVKALVARRMGRFTVLSALLCLAISTGTLFAAEPAIKYELSVNLDPEAHRLQGQGTMTLPAVNRPREVLQLALGELFEDLRVEIVQPEPSAGQTRLARKLREWTPGWGTNEWTITPVKPIAAGVPVILRFSYSGGGGKTGFVFYVGPEVSFGAGISTAWYPELEEAISDDDSNAKSETRLRGMRATGIVHFTVPKGHLVVASGKRVADASREQNGEFNFVVTQPVSFSFAAGRYTRVGNDSDGAVSAYVLRKRSTIQEYLSISEKVLSILSKEFGPYPYEKFALAEIPDEIAGNAGFQGASQEGLVITSSSTLDAPFNPNHYGHEISHQWWGNLIRRKGPRGNLMLDESMAEFGALRVVEQIEGKAAATTFRQRGDAGSALDQGAVAYFGIARAGLDYRLSELPEQWISRNLASSKGFLAIDLLSQAMGENSFRRALHRFTARYGFERVTWDEFLDTFRKESPNVTPFIDQWFEQTGAPDLSLTWDVRGKRLHGFIRQPRGNYHLAIDIRILGEHCATVDKQVQIEGPRAEFEFETAFSVKNVILDPEYRVLHSTPELQEEARALSSILGRPKCLATRRQ